MIKLLVKALIVLLLLAGLGHYLYYLNTGRPLSDLPELDGWMPSWDPGWDLRLPGLPQPEPEAAQPERVYKWLDEQGVTQYSTEPPPAGVEAQVLEIDPRTNRLEAPVRP